METATNLCVTYGSVSTGSSSPCDGNLFANYRRITCDDLGFKSGMNTVRYVLEEAVSFEAMPDGSSILRKTQSIHF